MLKSTEVQETLVALSPEFLFLFLLQFVLGWMISKVLKNMVEVKAINSRITNLEGSLKEHSSEIQNLTQELKDCETFRCPTDADKPD